MVAALSYRFASTLFLAALTVAAESGSAARPGLVATPPLGFVVGTHNARVVEGAPRPLSALGVGTDLGTRLAAIESTIESERRNRHVPGVALVIIKDGRVLTMRGFGFRDVERRLPVTADTLFPIGSMTKAFTALAAMMSVDDGRLSLDDSPKKYLPYFRLRDPEADQKITIADMLCHRTGLGRGGDLAWFVGVRRPSTVLRVAGMARPAAKFRQEFAYSNVMYLAAGEVVATVQRMPWSKVVARRIFQPLGMKSANTSIAALCPRPDHALGYTYNEATDQTTPMPMRDITGCAPAGAINASARDMARFLQMMLDGGVYGGRRLVSKERFAALTAPHTEMAPNVYYGYGWRVGAWNGHRLVEHGGSTDGFDAEAAFMPDEKLGVVLLSNLHFSSLRWVALETVWKHLVGAPEAPGAPATSGSADAVASPVTGEVGGNVAPLSVDALMQKVIEAAGGEAQLRRHRTLVTEARLELESHGLTGRSIVYSRAPNARAERVTLYAVGKKIATLNDHFDGTCGGCETSFTSSVVKAGKPLADAKIAAAFPPALNWRTLFPSVTITGLARVGGEEVYVVEKKPTEGDPVTDYISTRSFLLLKRESQAFAPESNGLRLLTETFSDYRAVDGVTLPFRRVQTIGWRGTTIVTVEKARFDAHVPNSVFQPREPGNARGTQESFNRAANRSEAADHEYQHRIPSQTSDLPRNGTRPSRRPGLRQPAKEVPDAVQAQRWIYADRAARRDRHHCHPGGDPLPRLRPGA